MSAFHGLQQQPVAQQRARRAPPPTASMGHRTQRTTSAATAAAWWLVYDGTASRWRVVLDSPVLPILTVAGAANLNGTTTLSTTNISSAVNLTMSSTSQLHDAGTAPTLSMMRHFTDGHRRQHRRDHRHRHAARLRVRPPSHARSPPRRPVSSTCEAAARRPPSARSTRRRSRSLPRRAPPTTTSAWGTDMPGIVNANPNDTKPVATKIAPVVARPGRRHRRRLRGVLGWQRSTGPDGCTRVRGGRPTTTPRSTK